MELALTRLVADRRPLLAALTLGGCILAGLGLTYAPFATAAAAFGAGILVLCIVKPLVAVGAMLAAGLLDISPVTGGRKALLQSEGGLDMNGVRLIALVAGLTLVVLLDRNARQEALSRRSRLYLAFLLYAGVSIYFSISYVDGLRQWFKMAYLFVVFVTVVALPRGREELDRLGDAMIVGGALVGWVLSPLLILFGQYVVDQGRVRIEFLGTHQNPESFYLLVIIIFCVARYAVRRQPRYLVVAAGCFLWIALAVVRIAFAAAVASAIAVMLTGALAARNRRIVLGMLATTAVLGMLLVPAVLQRSLGYMPSPAELYGMIRHPDWFWLSRHIGMEGREIYWPVVFGMFLQHPLTGAGLGASRGLLLRMFPASWSGAVHNEYLRLLSETGLIGITLFSAAVLGWTRRAVLAARLEDPLVREFALAAVGAAVVWGVTALTDNALDYYNQYAQHVVFLLAAAISATRFVSPARAAAPVAAAGAEPGPRS